MEQVQQLPTEHGEHTKLIAIPLIRPIASLR